jgi:outer membrane receptor protein involved in Fe transport
MDLKRIPAIRALMLLLALLVPSIPSGAQTDVSSLSGVVSDPSSAPVQNAEVRLQNRRTQAARTVKTDESGRFLFALLPPGEYSLEVEAPGFRTFRDDSVRLQVARAASVNIQLEVGALTERIEVSGTVSPLITESVAQGTVVTEEKIIGLPLNGREFIQLALLVPGANAGGRTVQQNSVRLNQTGGFSASGGRTNNNAFLLDGVANTDPDYNGLNYSPVIDAIAEFQVQTAQFSAEYGRASGAQINVVTKSGSNTFHGSAWEFMRNRALDARPFNLNVSKLPQFQRHQYGASLGGRIVRDKAFFFAAWERLSIRQAAAGLTTVAVPTQAQRNGDFSGGPGIFDPDTLAGGVRQPFPDFRIPESRLNPLTRAAMAAMPLPNIGTAQYVNASSVLRQNSDNGSIRLDWNVRRNLSLFGRYAIWDENNVIPDVVPDRDRLGFSRPQNAVLGMTQVLRPTLVNELRGGFNRLLFQDGLPEPLFNVGGAQRTLPRFVVAGYPTMGGAGGFTGTTGGGTVLVRNNTFQLYDNVSWLRGRHNFRFGGEVLWIQYNRFESANTLGQYQFTAGFTSRTASNDGTGHILASMLLGLPQQGSRSVGPSRIDGRQENYGLYFQDDWKIRPNLTLNLGLRYELAPPLYDHRQQMGSIDYRNVPSPWQIFGEGRLAFYEPLFFICGQAGYPKGCAHMDKNNFAPRAGLAWQLAPRTVVRAGAGFFYAANDLNPLFRLAAVLPGNIAQTLSSNAFIPQFRGFDIFGPAVVGPVQIQQAGIDLFQRSSYSPQWSFTVQQEIRRDLMVEAGYLATLGLKLSQNTQPNNARPGPGAVDPRRPYRALRFAPGTVFPPYVVVQGETVPVGFINYLPNAAQSNYHAFFLRVEKKLTGGLSWLSSYNWSKAITNAPQFRNAGGARGAENSPPQDSHNVRLERGLASFDVRHRWVNSAVWNLPFGPRQKWLNSGPGAWLAGGWQISAIHSMQTGFPFTANLAGDTAGIGGGTGAILIRPNAVPGQHWKLPASERTTERWFNTAAFVAPPAFQFGNVGRNTIIGPGMLNFDLMAARSFRITEGASLQFRGEFFNALNTPNYDIVGRILNNPQFGVVQSQLPPRQIQFGLRLAF